MSDPITAKFSLAALPKVKGAASKVVDTIQQMIQTVRIEDTPTEVTLSDHSIAFDPPSQLIKPYH